MNTLSILILFIPMAVSIFGASIACYNQISVTSFTLNMIAVFLGIPFALLLGSMQTSLQRYQMIISLIILVLMSASLLSFDIEGIHRWIEIGSIYINISMVLTPLILYAISWTLGRNQIYSVILAISVSLIHVLQPDAGQATAFGLAAISIFLMTRDISYKIRLIGIVSIGAGIYLAWRQPDSLPAVEQVELILHLAIRIGSLGVAGSVLSIIILLAPIFYTVQQQKTSGNNDVLAIAFIIYLVAAFCVTELGNYPVPIIGAGASTILGYYNILGLTVIPYGFKAAEKHSG